MKGIFFAVVSMSVSAAFAVPVVLLARLLLKKAPRVFSYALWAVIFLRLVCPVLPSASFGLIPSLDGTEALGEKARLDIDNTQTVGEEAADTEISDGKAFGAEMSDSAGQEASGVEMSDGAGQKPSDAAIPGGADQKASGAAIPGGAGREAGAPEPGGQTQGSNGAEAAPILALQSTGNLTEAGTGAVLLQQIRRLKGRSAEFLTAYSHILCPIWLAGAAGFLFYAAISSYRFMKKTGCASLRKTAHRRGKYRIVTADCVPAPFTTGVFRPVIYLPKNLEGMERSLILEHEKVHVARKDYLIKTLAYGIACVYWFAPLVWLSFFLMEKDMEISCDEAVLKRTGIRCKKSFAHALVNVAAGDGQTCGYPVGFGKQNVKERIRHVMKYRHAKWYTLAAAGAVVVLAAALVLVNRSQPPAGSDGQPTENGAAGTPDGTRNGEDAEKEQEEAGGQTSEAARMQGQTGQETIGKGETGNGEAVGTADGIVTETEWSGFLEMEDQEEGADDPYSSLLLAGDATGQRWTVFYSPPVENGRISATYGVRVHPLTQQKLLHGGVDYAAEEGTAVLAAADGTVYRVGSDTDFGNYVVLLHENREMTYYAHCKEILVSEGSEIKRGDKIAAVGKTGDATGAMVHFAVSFQGAWKEPVMEQIPDKSDVYGSHTWLTAAISGAILKENESRYAQRECAGEGHYILGKEEEGNRITAYVLTLYGEYSFQNGKFVKDSGSGVIPAVFSLRRQDSIYVAESIKYPMDGSYYGTSIREMFPEKLADFILGETDGLPENEGESLQDIREGMKWQEQTYAREYLRQIGRTAEVGDYGDFEWELLTEHGVSVEIANAMSETEKELGGQYPMWLGTQEQLEDGTRYIYEKALDEELWQIVYTKSEYDTGRVIEQHRFDADTGERIAADP